MPIELSCKAICMGVIEFACHRSGPGSVKEVHLVNIDPLLSIYMTNTLNEMIHKYCSDLKVVEIRGIASVNEEDSEMSAQRGAEETLAEEQFTLQVSDDCSICLDKMATPRILELCGHTFCSSCVEMAFQTDAVCPICKTRYGMRTGDQPEGTMDVTNRESSLPGYEGFGTIVIDYNFVDGIQGVSVQMLLLFVYKKGFEFSVALFQVKTRTL